MISRFSVILFEGDTDRVAELGGEGEVDNYFHLRYHLHFQMSLYIPHLNICEEFPFVERAIVLFPVFGAGI